MDDEKLIILKNLEFEIKRIQKEHNVLIKHYIKKYELDKDFKKDILSLLKTIEKNESDLIKINKDIIKLLEELNKVNKK